MPKKDNAPTKYPPEDLVKIADFLSEFKRESDRGLALIGAAFIDEKLAESLKAFFCDGSKEIIRGRNAPLGTFSARIEACYGLGLIDDIEKNECAYIRKIRNEFAHHVKITSFESGKIPDFCKNLKSELPDRSEKKYTSRYIFQNAMLSMSMRLFYRDKYVMKEKRAPKMWVEAESIRWRRTNEELPQSGEPVIGTLVNPTQKS